MAAALTSAACLHLGSNSGSSHSVANGCPMARSEPVALRISRSAIRVSSVRRLARICNEDELSRNPRLQRSQFFDDGLRGAFQLLLKSHKSQGIPSPQFSFRRRNFSVRSCSLHGSPCLLYPSLVSGLRGPPLTMLQSWVHKRRGQKRAENPGCIGASSGGLVALKPLLDEVLLLGTIFGVYIAGVTSLPRLPELIRDRGASSARQDLPPSQKSGKARPVQQQDRSPPQFPEYSGERCWSQLHEKVSQALLNEAPEFEEEVVKSPMLALQAIARVPRLRLLLRTVHHLRKEVMAIADIEEHLEPLQWQELSLSAISGCIAPVCRDWLAQVILPTKEPPDVSGRAVLSSIVVKYPEGNEGNSSIDLDDSAQWHTQRGNLGTSHSTEMNVLDSMMGILTESESIPSYIARIGKSDLYTDLIFILRFGSARPRGCCDHRVLKKHAGNVLEDMVVAIAEVVATLFLDCSSLTSLSPHGDMWQTVLLPSIPTSRSLERFRNEVALYGWLNLNFTSVTAMFEDRFELWTMRTWPVQSKEKQHGKLLTKKPTKITVGVKSPDLVLVRAQLPARRTRELKALTGPRYFYSLFLELSDVLGPLLSLLVTKLGDALSFLLTMLIGRSLGLVYRGVRDSVRWQKMDRSQ